MISECRGVKSGRWSLVVGLLAWFVEPQFLAVPQNAGPHCPQRLDPDPRSWVWATPLHHEQQATGHTRP
jgi:hypothetical protein